MSRTRAVLTAAVLLSALALGGCTDDDPEPKFGPTESTSPASPTAERSEQAAFVTDYFEAISAAIATGDPKPFLDMSSSACQNCKTIANNLREAYADGGRIEDGGWTAAAPTFDRSDSIGEIWNADVRTAQEHWIGSDGSLVKTVRASVQHFGIALEADGDGWIVRELRVSS